MIRTLAPFTAAAALALASFAAGPGIALAAGSGASATRPTSTTTTTSSPPSTTTTITSTPTTTTPTPTTTTPTTTTPTTTTPTTTPAPAVQATAKLYLSGAFYVNGDAVTVPGRTVLVEGYVHPYAPGQTVEVQTFVGTRRIKRDRLRIKPLSGDRSGAFTEKIESPVAGLVTVKVIHTRTSAMLGFLALRRVDALSEQIGFGSRGPLVTLIQRQLAWLHFYLPQSGVYDSFTGLAVDAYHRLLGDGVAQTVDPVTITDLLNGTGRFVVRFPNQGLHAEGDLTHQILALVNGSKVQYLFPISSGKPSTPTVLGSWQIYRRTPGYLPDGMYYSDFFTGGYAIHGYDPAPDYPASHGCMRLPIQDAIFVFDWLNYNDWVDTYYR